MEERTRLVSDASTMSTDALESSLELEYGVRQSLFAVATTSKGSALKYCREAGRRERMLASCLAVALADDALEETDTFDFEHGLGMSLSTCYCLAETQRRDGDPDEGLRSLMLILRDDDHSSHYVLIRIEIASAQLRQHQCVKARKCC